MQILIDATDGTETVKLKAGEESAIDNALAWLTACKRYPHRFPQAGAAYDALVDTRAHVDKAPEAKK